MVIDRALYPFTSHFYDRNGLRYHYLDEGSGDPVIMLHGNPTWSFYYRELAKRLRSKYRVLVPDHIGCGLSDKPDDSQYHFTLQSRVDDLAAWLDHLHLDRNLTLIAHDWGGMIGMAYAVQHPERFKRIVLLNTAAFHLPPAKAMPMSLTVVRDSRIGAWGVQYLNAFARGAAWIGCTRQRMPRPLRDAYCAPYDTPAHRLATLRFVQDIPLRPGDPAYDLVTETQQRLSVFCDTPIMICWGGKDFVFDKHFLQEWQRQYPHADVHFFADCGHYILEDAQAEIGRLVETFLKDHPISSR